MALVAYGSSEESENSDNEENTPSTSDIINSLKCVSSGKEKGDQDALTHSNENVSNRGGCSKETKRSLSAFLSPPKLSNLDETADVNKYVKKLVTSESEEKEISHNSSGNTASRTDSSASHSNLFASLPPPKRNTVSIFNQDFELSSHAKRSEISENRRSEFPALQNEQHRNKLREISCEQKTPKEGSVSNSEKSLNGSTKKKDHVKITIPSLSEFQEENDGQPVTKKRKPLSFVSGLVSLLPEPRNKSLKEASRLLVPHVLNKKQDRMKDPSLGVPKASSINFSSSPSVQKKLVLYDKNDSDEEENEDESNVQSCDYFSLVGTSSNVHLSNKNVYLPVMDKKQVSSDSMASASNRSMSSSQKEQVSYESSEEEGSCTNVSVNCLSSVKPSFKIPASSIKNEVSSDNYICNDMLPLIKENKQSSKKYTSDSNDAPLNFKTGWTPAEKHHDEYSVQSTLSNNASDVPSNSEEEYQNPYSEFEGKNMFSDEGFMRLQGKKRKGKEDIHLIDIHADEQLPGSTEWLTKSITEEIVHRPSRKKHNLPTQQQRRKHQITYLAFQAKERELELKNQWSQNRMTRRQTQSKYGF